MGRSVLPATPVAFTAAPALAQAEQGPPDAAFEPARETQARAPAPEPAPSRPRPRA